MPERETRREPRGGAREEQAEDGAEGQLGGEDAAGNTAGVAHLEKREARDEQEREKPHCRRRREELGGEVFAAARGVMERVDQRPDAGARRERRSDPAQAAGQSAVAVRRREDALVEEDAEGADEDRERNDERRLEHAWRRSGGDRQDPAGAREQHADENGGDGGQRHAADGRARRRKLAPQLLEREEDSGDGRAEGRREARGRAGADEEPHPLLRGPAALGQRRTDRAPHVDRRSLAAEQHSRRQRQQSAEELDGQRLAPAQQRQRSRKRSLDLLDAAAGRLGREAPRHENGSRHEDAADRRAEEPSGNPGDCGGVEQRGEAAVAVGRGLAEHGADEPDGRARRDRCDLGVQPPAARVRVVAQVRGHDSRF